MKQQPLAFLAALLLAGGTLAAAASAASAANDALVSQSYVTGSYLHKIQQKASDTASAVFSQKISGALAQAERAYRTDTLKDALEDQVLGALGETSQESALSLSPNMTLTCPAGTELSLTSGRASVTRGSLVNLSQGTLVPAGDALSRNQIYLTAEDNTVVQASGSASMRILGDYVRGQGSGGTSSTEHAQYTAYADALQTLSLFQGSNKGYELSRTSTRVEGVVMLIRLLGRDTEAKAYTGTHPFTDVPAWADSYVAYAYRNGYTSGMSATTFGASTQLRYRDYMTFLLRALGYSDANGDFSWATADQTAVMLGIQTAIERNEILNSGHFLRDHMVYTSYRALFSPTKSGRRLCDQLMLRGVFPQETLLSVEARGL